MKCSRIRRVLHLYYYSELAPDHRREVSRHLSDCPACAAEYSRLTTLMDGLTRAAAPPASLDADRTWERIRAGMGLSPTHPGLRPWLRIAAAFLVFAVGLGTGLWLNRRAPQTTTPGTPAARIVSASEWNRFLGDLEMLLLDAGNSAQPIPAAAGDGGPTSTVDRLLFQNRSLSRNDYISPEARDLLEETALLLQEIRNHSQFFQSDPGWLKRIIEERHMLERIRLFLYNGTPGMRREVHGAPVI